MSISNICDSHTTFISLLGVITVMYGSMFFIFVFSVLLFWMMFRIVGDPPKIIQPQSDFVSGKLTQAQADERLQGFKARMNKRGEGKNKDR